MTNHISKMFDQFCDSLSFESTARDPASSPSRKRFEDRHKLFLTAHREALEVISKIEGPERAEAIVKSVILAAPSGTPQRAKSRDDDYEPHH
jgi:hypothetical protein